MDRGRQWIEDYVYQHHFKMFPVVDNSDLVGCISIDNIKKVPRGDWDTRTVGQVMETGDARSLYGCR
jgi:predicted transcriptional regulator